VECCDSRHINDGDDGLKEDSIRYVSVLGGLLSKGTGRSWLLISGRFVSLPAVKCVCSRGRVPSLPIDLVDNGGGCWVRPGTYRFPPDLLWKTRRGVVFRGGRQRKDLLVGVRDITPYPAVAANFVNSPNLGGENRAG
jgi:hypothetical protein